MALRVPDDPPDPIIAMLPSPDASSDAVGAINGAFRVDESGSATYSIPLIVAPGSGGVAPQISLNYSSQGGNGIMGLGWSLGGLSAITRCRQTQETDGANVALELATTDRYCLDGQKLVAVNGSYGSSGTEYRTEVDSYAEIYSFGQTGNGPDYFEVHRKDGTTWKYGADDVTSNSQNVANGADSTTIVSWMVSSIRDSSINGNEITFAYGDFGAGEKLVTQIDYSQNNHMIVFGYETRPDTSSGYLAGSHYEATQRLASITTWANGSALRTYDLTYQNSSDHGLSELTSVEECDGSGSVCYPATTFNWSDISNGFASAAPPNWFAGNYAGAKPGDVDGDGLNDLVIQSGNILVVGVSHGTYLEIRYDDTLSIGNVSSAFWHLLDYNGDGLQDLLYAHDGYWWIKIATPLHLLSQPDISTGIAASSLGGQAIDVNGDGLTDLVSGGGSLWVHYLLPSNGSLPYAFEQSAHEFYLVNLSSPWPFIYTNYFDATKSFAADVNGDGNVEYLAHVIQSCNEMEICQPSDVPWYKWVVMTSSVDPLTGTAYLTALYTLADQTVDAFTADDFRVVDLNGDGYSDVMMRTDHDVTWRAFLSNGKTLIPSGTVVLPTSDIAKSIRFTDYDRDGKMDLLYFQGNGPYGTIRAFKYDGDGNFLDRNGDGTVNFFDVVTVASGFTGADTENQILAMDINGDGRQDLVDLYFGSAPATDVRLAASAFTPDMKIDRITNGLGAQTDITYNSMLDPVKPNLYEKETDANTLNWGSPVFDLESSVYVVSRVASSAPVSGDLAAKSGVSYSYVGAKIQSGGRGFLGFHELSSTDDQTLVKTTTTYAQKFPFTGMPLSTVVSQPNNNTLSEATNTLVEYTASDCGTGSAARPYISQSVEKAYDLNDASLIKTVTTSTTQDECGNVLTINVETVDGQFTATGGATYQTNTTNSYYDDIDFDLVQGRLKDTVVVHQRGGSSQTRKSWFDYDTTTGFLTKEIIEPDQASLKLTTTYTHDSFGNRVASTTSATGYDSRVTTFTYDLNGQYVDKKTNALNYDFDVVTARNSFGQPTTIKDINGHAVHIVYGSMGRKFYEQNETGGDSKTTFVDCSVYCIGAPSGAAYMTETESAGSPTQRTYFDVLGREVRSATEGFDGTWVHVDTEYDNVGRVHRTSEPYYDGSIVYWSTFTYDLLGRVIQVVRPDSSTTTMSYDGGTDFETVITNALYQTQTEDRNGLGELVKVTDNIGGQILYSYDAQGNLSQVTPPGNVIPTTLKYDLRGRKTCMNDPDKGRWRYTYNPFGELETQTNAKGQTSTVSYDKLGRMVSRVDTIGGSSGDIDCSGAFIGSVVVGDAAWLYDVGGNALGNLYREDIRLDGAGTAAITRTYSYGPFSRIIQLDTDIAGEGTFTQRTTYDEYGRVFQQFDAADYLAGEQYEYNGYGYRYRTIEAGNSANEDHEYHKIVSLDARGNVTEEEIGGLASTRDFDAATGRINRIVAQNGFLQDLSYSFDELGNLTGRSDDTYGNSFSETFTYDDLNRLTASSSVQATNLTITYDGTGNIETKSNMQGGAVYNYGGGTCGGGPHAVTSVGSITYCYDANGNMTSSSDGRTIDHTTFDKPDRIQKGSHTTEFLYGPNRSRFERMDTEGGQSTTTLYLGNVERITRPSGVTETKRYIGGKVIVTTTSVNPDPVELLVLTDHIGSTYALANRDTGYSLNQGMSFDAFGLRRDTDWTGFTTQELVTFNTSNTKKGYTGHEQMDEVGLIHMNGRVYDPRLGRFLEADPIVQAPANTQSYNRYTYVLNNPLSYTDPTGFSWWTDFRDGFLRPVLSIAASVFIPGSGLLGLGMFGSTVAAGFIAGGIATGSLKGAVIGAFSGAVFGAIGQRFRDAGLNNLLDTIETGDLGGLYYFGDNLLTAGQIAGQLSLHAIAGGVLSVLQGGKFGHGFIAAGITKSATNWEMRGGVFGGTIRSAVIGGSVSKISGGKFANGAVTAAFAYTMSAAAQGAQKDPGRPLTTNEIAEAKKVYGDDIDYSKVRVFDKKFFFFQSKDVMMAPDGNIYAPGAGSCADFTTCRVPVPGKPGYRYDMLGTYIHEMGHVMQYQNGTNVLGQGLLLQSARFLSFGLYNPGTYSPGVNPSTLNIEAQAQYYRNQYCASNPGCSVSDYH